MFLLFLIYLVEFPHILAAAFGFEARKAVWDWLRPVMGHKMWAGENTHKLLGSLAHGLPELGRSRWLLLNFLQQDIESKVRPQDAPLDAAPGDTQSNGGPTPKWLYEINVCDWDVRRYSQFLASNMMHAEQSIRWVVDPRDFFGQVLPAHIMEVVISLGMKLFKDIQDTVEEASLTSPSGTKLSDLLHDLIHNCERNGESCGVMCLPENILQKIVLVDDVDPETRVRDLDWIWGAVYCATLCRLSNINANVSGGKLSVNGREIESAVVRKEYFARVRKGLKPRLIHVDEFRGASCTKRRYVYMGAGGAPASADLASTRVAQWVAPDLHDRYVEAAVPRFAFKSKRGSSNADLIYSWSLLDGEASQPLRMIEDGLTETEMLMRDMIRKLDGELRKLILAWALDLFAETSGGEECVGAVFCEPHASRKYPESHDIGIYDDRLEVTSRARDSVADEPGLERDITWRLYNGVSPLVVTYFPDPGRKILDYAGLKTACLGILS